MTNPASERELDILILGPVPPPFGGVAVHISRVVPLLQRAGLRVQVLNHFGSAEPDFVAGALKRNPLNYYRLPKRIDARVVHYHHSHWPALLAVALGKGTRRSRYLMTIHGTSLLRRLSSRAPFVARVTRWAIAQFDSIIVVSPQLRAALQDHVGGRPIDVLPAFLPADDEGSRYERSIETFLADGQTLLAPVFRLRFLRDGRESYGLDTVMRAFTMLAAGRPQLRLALFIAEPPVGRKASRYLERLGREVEAAGLHDRVLTVFGQPLTPAFRHDVVLVRATRTDGDALSIREALAAGVPVVASDVTDRPAGTVTFVTDDARDLCRALAAVLEHSVRPHGAEHASGDAHFLAPLIEIYRRHLV
jgi:glycosyltransferase involved in cell wall biosynthesis